MTTLSRIWACAMALTVAQASAHATHTRSHRVPLAVLGDSNSQARTDPLGGPDTAVQWTQLLAQWRGHQLDLGHWGSWGQQRLLALAAEWLGQTPLRTPRKWDYAYNFAVMGQGCANLLGGSGRQALLLRRLIEANPGAWADGVVVLHIGAADFMSGDWMELASRAPAAAPVTATVRACQDALTRTVALLEAIQPRLRLVLVGAFNEANDPSNWSRWHNPAALQRIERALDPFDRHLRQLAAQAPARRVFLDQRAWYARHWGGRDPATGLPAYRTPVLGGLHVKADAGPGPTHAMTPDLHFGTAANALWAQELLATLHRQWPELHLTPIGDAELEPLWSGLQSTTVRQALH